MSMLLPNTSYVFAEGESSTRENDWLNKATVPEGWVTMSVDANVLGMGFIREPVRVPYYYGDDYGRLIFRFLGNANIDGGNYYNDTNYSSMVFLNTIKLEGDQVDDFKDLSNFKLPSIVSDNLVALDPDYTLKANDDEWLGTGDCVDSSTDTTTGWAYTVNNQVPYYEFNGGTMSSYSEPSKVKVDVEAEANEEEVWKDIVKEIEGDAVLRLQFSTSTRGTRYYNNSTFPDLGLKGKSSSPFESADYSKLLEQVANINSSSNKEVLLSNEAVKEAYDEANDILTSITVKEDQDKVDQARDKLASTVEQSNIDDGVNTWIDPTHQEGYVIMSVDANVLGKGFLKEPYKVPLYIGDDNYIRLIFRFLGTNNVDVSYGDKYSTTLRDVVGIRLKDPNVFTNPSTFNIDQKILDIIGSKSKLTVKNGNEKPLGSAKGGMLKADYSDCLCANDYRSGTSWIYSVNNSMPADRSYTNYDSYTLKIKPMSSTKPNNGDVFRCQFSFTGGNTDLAIPYLDERTPNTTPCANSGELLKEIAEINSSQDRDQLLKYTQLKKAYDEANELLTSIKLQEEQEQIDNKVEELKEVVKKAKYAIENVQTPVITTQPKSAEYYKESVAEPLNVAIEDINENEEVTYQWYENDKNSTEDGTLIKDATDSSYTPSTSTLGPKYYYVEITNTNTINNNIQTTIVSNLARIKVKRHSPSGGDSSSDGNNSSGIADSTTEKVDTAKILAGADRYETAVKISQDGWNKADNVIITSGDAYADALVASPLSTKQDAPVLLTKKGDIPNVTSAEIKRLGAKNITIIGGENVVSSDVVKDLEKAGLKVNRIAGKDRYETSIEVAKEVSGDKNIDKAYIVGGYAPADAVSISAKAGIENTPIIFVDKANLDTRIEEF
ncbi:MAG: cell wall-binding repeat-containing protein, partial [Clostridioides sp.]|nr:cell wall-binding repeat-containing protein [Clostridioides sp.]